MNTNPWLVDSIKAFSFLNCPECDFRSQEENLFSYHAAKNHPLSSAFYDKKIELEKSSIALKTVERSPADSEKICENFDNDSEKICESFENDSENINNDSEKICESFENDSENINSGTTETHEGFEENIEVDGNEIGSSEKVNNPKGQLISKCPFGVFKIQIYHKTNKIFKGFLP